MENKNYENKLAEYAHQRMQKLPQINEVHFGMQGKHYTEEEIAAWGDVLNKATKRCAAYFPGEPTRWQRFVNRFKRLFIRKKKGFTLMDINEMANYAEKAIGTTKLEPSPELDLAVSRWDMYSFLREAGKTDKEAKGIVDREFADKDEIVICVEGGKNGNAG